jgi:putative flippase GtrA
MALPTVLIPAYKPDQKMIVLINALRQLGFTRLLVINDGSGAAYDACFEQAAEKGCQVLQHAINMGKGRALKTGFNAVMLSDAVQLGVITADADGQHTPGDILRVAHAMQDNPQALVLGVRRFTGKVPWKNRLGNAITRGVFTLVNGFGVLDTQTGLRGLPACQLTFALSLNGERYEYEMNMLLEAKPNDVPIIQVPIDTVYIEGNRSSHYRAFVDSVRIYALILKYIFSSLAAGAVDYGVFALMHLSLPDQLIGSVVVARVCSSAVNFLLNRNIVFRQKGTVAHAACRYYALAALIMASSYFLIRWLTGPLGLNVFVAKILSDCVLSLFSFYFQREFVYTTSLKARIVRNGNHNKR